MPETFTTAAQAVDWIFGLRYKGEKCGLSNMRALLERLGSPEKGLRCVHVAGTNGKGSTCAMLERMLRACGLKTGLYTSPYLMHYGDRIRVNGLPIPDGDFVRLTERVREAVEALLDEGVRPTAFELGTAVCFLYFAEQRVDVAVIEVGMGGRLDATNVIVPEVSVIAPIGMDHTHILGDTLTLIAAEKAGIIKEGVPVIVQDQALPVREVFHRAAQASLSPIVDLADSRLVIERIDARGAAFTLNDERAEIRLCGRHQVQNAALALSTIHLLRQKGWSLPEDKALEGLKQTVWPGRLEWLEDRLLIDGAHNPHGAQALAEYVQTFLKDRRIVLLVGMMKDKDVAACTHLYAQIAREAVCTQVDYPRAMPGEELARLCRAQGMDALAEPSVPHALEIARERAGSDGLVIVCGSLYLVGDVRLRLHDDDGQL